MSTKNATVRGHRLRVDIKFITPSGGALRSRTSPGTKSEMPEHALAGILQSAFIFYGVPWMDAQWKRARAAEIRRAREHKKRGGTR